MSRRSGAVSRALDSETASRIKLGLQDDVRRYSREAGRPLRPPPSDPADRASVGRTRLAPPRPTSGTSGTSGGERQEARVRGPNQAVPGALRRSVGREGSGVGGLPGARRGRAGGSGFGPGVPAEAAPERAGAAAGERDGPGRVGLLLQLFLVVPEPPPLRRDRVPRPPGASGPGLSPRREWLSRRYRRRGGAILDVPDAPRGASGTRQRVGAGVVHGARRRVGGVRGVPRARRGTVGSGRGAPAIEVG